LPEAGTRDPRPSDQRPAVRRPQASPVRSLLAAVLAVPVLAWVYAGLLVRRLAPRHEPAIGEPSAPTRRLSASAGLAGIRSPGPSEALALFGVLRRASLVRAAPALRPALVVAVGALLTISTYGAAPEPLQANPATAAAPTPPPRAVARVGPAVISGHGLLDALNFDFTSPMDPATVQSALLVQPAATLQLAWSSGGKTLRVSPARAWSPATAYTLTIGAGARDMLGLALAAPVQASFQTRPSASARLVVQTAKTSPLSGMVELRFSRPVAVASVPAALRISPRSAGTISPLGATTRGLGTRFSWRPSGALKPGTSYTFKLAGTVVDEDGVRIPASAQAALRTPGRPGIVRHRPSARATGVPRDALISVRFTERMDRRSTERAFSVNGLVAARDGAFSWHDGDTVLAYDPKAPLTAGRAYTVAIAGSARSGRGISIRAARTAALSFTFRTKAAATLSSVRVLRPSTGGGSTATGWLAVERYVLGLVNCIRTGGTLQSDGDCVGYGSGRNGGYARPLTLHSGISTKVARPYAKYLAVRAACNHFLDGNPGFRLRRSGYTSYRWAENLGCRSGNPYTAVLGSHLYFQSEKSYRGGHWVNLKNPIYTTVGIGVWVSNGNVRVVTNFYDP
jgi:hypothetical protein